MKKIILLGLASLLLAPGIQAATTESQNFDILQGQILKQQQQTQAQIQQLQSNLQKEIDTVNSQVQNQIKQTKEQLQSQIQQLQEQINKLGAAQAGKR